MARPAGKLCILIPPEKRIPAFLQEYLTLKKAFSAPGRWTTCRRAGRGIDEYLQMTGVQ
jgi:hypothetical protein